MLAVPIGYQDALLLSESGKDVIVFYPNSGEAWEFRREEWCGDKFVSRDVARSFEKRFLFDDVNNKPPRNPTL